MTKKIGQKTGEANYVNGQSSTCSRSIKIEVSCTLHVQSKDRWQNRPVHILCLVYSLAKIRSTARSIARYFAVNNSLVKTHLIAQLCFAVNHGQKEQIKKQQWNQRWKGRQELHPKKIVVVIVIVGVVVIDTKADIRHWRDSPRPCLLVPIAVCLVK